MSKSKWRICKQRGNDNQEGENYIEVKIGKKRIITYENQNIKQKNYLQKKITHKHKITCNKQPNVEIHIATKNNTINKTTTKTKIFTKTKQF